MAPRYTPPVPPEDIIAKFEAKHGKVCRCSFDLRAGIRVDVIFRPFTEASFDRYWEQQLKAPDDAVVNAMTNHILWPYGGDLDLICGAFGAFPGLVVAAMTQQAGGGTQTSVGARVDPLDDDTPDAVLDAAGLSRSQAEGFIAQSHGLVQMSVIVPAGGIGALVVRAPSHAGLQRLTRAFAKREGAGPACRQAAIDGAAWSSRPVAEILAAAPALAANVIGPEILRLGGAGAEAQFPGVVDGARGAAT